MSEIPDTELGAVHDALEVPRHVVRAGKAHLTKDGRRWAVGDDVIDLEVVFREVCQTLVVFGLVGFLPFLPAEMVDAVAVLPGFAQSPCFDFDIRVECI